ncbi:MAG: hypothetical protein RIG61_05125 [Deltaproteobacteria bacterium]
MLRKVLLSVCIMGVLGILPLTALSQSTAPAPAAPDVINTPPDFPEYIVTPREDLNPYNLSTMDKTTGTDYREGAGTLGTTRERSSNIEINESLKREKEEREKAKQESEKEPEKGQNGSTTDGADSAQAARVTAPAAPKRDISSPGVRGGLFTWTDEDGVLHATNDLGQVPIEYQVQALENQKSIGVKKGAD